MRRFIKKLTFKHLILLIAPVLLVLFCNQPTSLDPEDQSDSKIESFTINGITANISLETVGGKYPISLALPFGLSSADIESAEAEAKLSSSKATIAPNPQSITDYTTPQDFTVTAENGDERVYTVTVTIRSTFTLQFNTHLADRVGAGDFNKTELFLISDIVNSEWSYELTVGGLPPVEGTLTAEGNHIAIDGSVYTIEEWDSIGDGIVGVGVTLSKGEIEETVTSNTLKEQYKVKTWQDLQGVKYDLDSNYTLENNIMFPAAGTEGFPEEGFEPIGYNYNNRFKGSFDGKGNRITNFYINRPTLVHAGLFGCAGDTGSEIKDLGIELAPGGITGKRRVGGLVGFSPATGKIVNSYVIGETRGDKSVGGLVGENNGEIRDSYASGTVTGNSGPGANKEFVGGLVGYDSGVIKSSFASGNVVGNNSVGGLIGYSENSSSLTNSYASVNVSGENRIGGLVGRSGGEIANSYATGSVTGSEEVGGLVGRNWRADIINSYATGAVADGVDRIGGLIGYHRPNGTLTYNYWDIATTTQSGSDGEGAAAVIGVSSGENLEESGGGYIDTGNGNAPVFEGWSFGSIESSPWVWGANGEWPTLYWSLP